MSLNIRSADSEDVDAVVRVWERARWAAQPWLEERMQHTHADNLGHYVNVISRENDIRVAERAGEIVAFLATHDDVIGYLYVDPDHQDTGVGTQLLDFAKDRSPGRLTLYTHQRNERARAFYERRGFVAVEFGVSPEPESEPDVRYVWSRDPTAG